MKIKIIVRKIVMPSVGTVLQVLGMYVVHTVVYFKCYNSIQSIGDVHSA